MSKKILLIIGILAIIGIAAFFILTSKPQAGEGETRVGFSIRDYLPFGRTEEPGPNDGIITREDPTDENIVPTTDNQGLPRLKKLSNEPVAGAVVFGTGSTSLVRFVEKGTGNVYEADALSGTVTRLTNTTIPKIVRALWLPNGSGFLAQTLEPESEIVETSFVKLNKNSASSTTETLTPFTTLISKLPTGIKEIAVKPDSTKIFYYTAIGSSDWFVSNPDGTSNSPVFSHPLTEWLPTWVSGNTVMMQQKGSSESSSYIYSFDITAKTLKKIGMGGRGLSSIPNTDGSLTLAAIADRVPQLFLIDNKTASSKALSASTLADKCVWLKTKEPSLYCAIPNQLPAGNYPDIWYKGLVSTADSIKKIEANNDIFYNIADLSAESKQKIDVVDISVSPNESYLIFRNKIDGFLWMLRIKE